jgi:hypothetical protein
VCVCLCECLCVSVVLNVIDEVSLNLCSTFFPSAPLPLPLCPPDPGYHQLVGVVRYCARSLSVADPEVQYAMLYCALLCCAIL